MKILLVRDRNVLNTNWLVFYANLLAERGHDVVIACDTYGKLGVKVWIYKGEVLPTKGNKEGSDK